jgi:hypothetical protein
VGVDDLLSDVDAAVSSFFLPLPDTSQIVTPTMAASATTPPPIKAIVVPEPLPLFLLLFFLFFFCCG